jgi:hypothetical protein
MEERFMAMVKFKGDDSDEENLRRMAAMMGPGHVDQMVRQAIHSAWMMLPKERRNIDELEKQIQRMVDRAIRDMREDVKQFGRDK